MIKELSRDLVTLIHKDYPELEELNLASNGKHPHRPLNLLLPLVEISIVQNLDIFTNSLRSLNLASNQLRSLSDAHLTLTQS